MGVMLCIAVAFRIFKPQAATPVPPPATIPPMCNTSNAARLGALANETGRVPLAARRRAIVLTTEDAWCAYYTGAWGADDLKPLSKSGAQWLHLAATGVDALDTLLAMRLYAKSNATADMVVERLSVRAPDRINAFEATIRVLGGLVSACHASRDVRLLRAAAALGADLSVVFNSPTTIPYSDVDLSTRAAWAVGRSDRSDSAESSLAEAGTMRLEFDALSLAVGAEPFEESGSAQALLVAGCAGGLAPGTHVSPVTGEWTEGGEVGIGAHSDSFYEYLLKSWIHGGKRDPWLLEAHQNAVQGVTTRLLARSPREGLLYVGKLVNGELVPSMEHLACFYPGLLALAHMHDVRTRPEHAAAEATALGALGLADQMGVARELLATCVAMGKRPRTGVAPERVRFEPPGTPVGGDMFVERGRGRLRPETVESLFLMHRATGEARYRHEGWAIWRAIQLAARVPGGYAALEDVTRLDTPHMDVMESYFIAETLKYLWLLFSDSSALNLQTMVLNTEGHAFPVRTPT